MKELSLKTNAQGEAQVELYKDGKRKTFIVQSLVEEAFPPEEPAEDLPAEETPLQPEELPLPPVPPTRPPGRPIHQLNLYDELIKQWADVDQIRKELGYHPGTIFECCMTPQKSAYGFKWQYAE
jgi:hypothetical protein